MTKKDLESVVKCLQNPLHNDKERIRLIKKIKKGLFLDTRKKFFVTHIPCRRYGRKNTRRHQE